MKIPPAVRPLYRFSFVGDTPVQTITSGQEIIAELPDSDGLGPELTPLPEELFDGVPDRGNPVYGPIAVEGARAGDALRISFRSIRPNRRIARTLLAPNHGFLPDNVMASMPRKELPEKPRHMYHWDVDGGVARLANLLGEKPVSIPARPFLGCIATATSEALSSLLAHHHGGNVDHPDLVEGTSLWLPVALPGGLLYLGDMHAAQGQGETAGGGLEISGVATVGIELCAGMNLSLPRYETPEGYGCLAVAGSVEAAMRLALAGLIHWVADAGWQIHDAGMLVNQTCRFRAGGITERYAVTSCFIGHENLSGATLA